VSETPFCLKNKDSLRSILFFYTNKKKVHEKDVAICFFLCYNNRGWSTIK